MASKEVTVRLVIDDEHRRRIETDDEYREAILSWLRANDIDPAHVPAHERPSLADGKLTLRMLKLNSDGKRQWDLRQDGPLTHTVTVPLLVPPTPDVELWLTPPCPTCGR